MPIEMILCHLYLYYILTNM